MGAFYLLYAVKYIFLAQFMLLFFCAGTLQAQNDDWDTYMARLGSKPASILVNMALVQNAPDSKLPYLVTTGPKVQTCGKDGLPAKEEIDHLEEILDATDNFITGVTAKVLAGTMTFNCERVNYYYVKDTAGIRFALMRMYNRSYPDYGYVINIRKDPDWHTYRTFLYPDEQMKNWMENDKIVTNMLQHGDSLTKQRTISFELYFRSDTDRASFTKFAKEKGYTASQLMQSQSQTVPYELIISRYDYVKMDSIAAMSQEIKQEMRRYKGFYNGWSAPLTVTDK